MRKSISLFLTALICFISTVFPAGASEFGEIVPFCDFESFPLDILRQTVNGWYGMGEATLAEGSGYYKVSVEKEQGVDNKVVSVYSDGVAPNANVGSNSSFTAVPDGFVYEGRVCLEEIGKYASVYVSINGFLDRGDQLLTFTQGKIRARHDAEGRTSVAVMNFRPGEHWYKFKMIFDFTGDKPCYELFVNDKSRGVFEFTLSPTIDWQTLSLRFVVQNPQPTGKSLAYLDDVKLSLILGEDGMPQENTPPPPSIDPKVVYGFENEDAWFTEALFIDKAEFGFEESDLRIKDGGATYKDYAKGFSLSSTNVKEGLHSLKWSNLPFYPTLSTKEVERDWSGYNMASFWVYSEAKTDDVIVFSVQSDSIVTEWKDYYYIELHMDFEGWREFNIPFELLTPYENVVGFKKVDGISFYSKIFDRNPSPYTVIYFDNFRLSNADAETIEKAKADLNLPETQMQKVYFNVYVPGNHVLTPQRADKFEYITKCVPGFEKVKLFEYRRYIENKRFWAETTDETQKAEYTEYNRQLRERYGITQDAPYDEFVDLQTPLVYGSDLTLYRGEYLNHDFPEVVSQPDGAIQYLPYFKNERAQYGYYPKYRPAVPSFDYEGNAYMKYGPIIQTVDERGRWYYTDITPFVSKYVDEALHYSDFRYRTIGQLDEPRIVFDKDGDGYMMFVIQGREPNGKDSRRGILAHSNDGLKTWEVYPLPAEMNRFEKHDTFNAESWDYPPAILSSGSANDEDKNVGGTLIVPKKLPDGTLDLSEQIRIAPDTVLCFTPHSGDGNFMVSAEGKIFITYSITYQESLPAEYRALIPDNHPMNDDSFSWEYLWTAGEMKFSRTGVPSYVIAYDRELGTITDPVFVGYGGWQGADGHNWSTISIDNNGYLNIVMMGHSDPLVYARSKNPYDISEWIEHQMFATEDRTRASYAGLWTDSKGTMYSINRDSQIDGFDLILTRKKQGGGWEKIPVVKFDQRNNMYTLWLHKMSINTKNDKLFLTYYAGVSSQSDMTKEDSGSMFFHRPDIEKANLIWFKSKAAYPRGAKYSATGKAVTLVSSYNGDMCTLVSDDGGTTWRLAVTEDFINN
ncbi:MAG: BNR-4 repeat-containing protein [Firmicutes bacterium]|nr:BNR-4 repeat-containing protein [Bacillota bacterium]